MFRQAIVSLICVSLAISSVMLLTGCSCISDVQELASELFSGTSEEVEGSDGKYIIYHNIQPRHLKSPSGESARLVNNDEASPPTWQELMAFLEADATDQNPYNIDSFACVAFAEELHNNAEAAGIEAAFVGVQFEGREVGHALNAFHTTDRGLVFIDCTSPIQSDMPYVPMLGLDDGEVGDGEVVGADKVAYVELGKEYGVISVEVATSPEYSFYLAYLAEREQYGLDVEEFNQDLEAYNQRVDAFNQEVEAYNQALEAYEQEVEAYNRALGGRTVLPEPEYSQFEEWSEELEETLAALTEAKAEIKIEQLVLMSLLAELQERQLEIEAASGGIGDVNWLPLGVVVSIEVYY
ncbi:MAG TPA: hypothetical protein G4O18_04970 [Dehalococcoidia bacterium]|nr:hypothetical protein [Dehalococcoidia bacterium]